jgi:hypothetical protein
MYLVELRPGKEELYRSSDELALAIRNGDVDARSRVYHRATAKWISITLHPQYKAIVAASKDEPARSARRGWGILGGAAGPAPEPAASDGTVSNGRMPHRWRRPLALGISGLLLLSGIQLAFSGPRPPWAGRNQSMTAAMHPAVPVARAAKARKARETVRSQEASTRREAPQLVSLARAEKISPRRSADAAIGSPLPLESGALPRAPRLRSRSLREALDPGSAKAPDSNSLEAVFARYAAAHDSARVRLETGMRVARLHRLFAASRLSPNGGVTDTRMSLAGAANFIRVFRRQQAAIEQAYQDTVTLLARDHGWPPRKVREWYSRPMRKEPPTLELLSGTLVASIDSVLGVLQDQAGAYKLRGTAIAFEDPTAGQAYGVLRRRIKEQIDAAVVAGGATSAGPTGLLLQAIGTTALPRET